MSTYSDQAQQVYCTAAGAVNCSLAQARVLARGCSIETGLKHKYDPESRTLFHCDFCETESDDYVYISPTPKEGPMEKEGKEALTDKDTTPTKPVVPPPPPPPPVPSKATMDEVFKKVTAGFHPGCPVSGSANTAPPPKNPAAPSGKVSAGVGKTDFQIALEEAMAKRRRAMTEKTAEPDIECETDSDEYTTNTESTKQATVKEVNVMIKKKDAPRPNNKEIDFKLYNSEKEILRKKLLARQAMLRSKYPEDISEDEFEKDMAFLVPGLKNVPKTLKDVILSKSFETEPGESTASQQSGEEDAWADEPDVRTPLKQNLAAACDVSKTIAGDMEIINTKVIYTDNGSIHQCVDSPVLSKKTNISPLDFSKTGGHFIYPRLGGCSSGPNDFYLFWYSQGAFESSDYVIYIVSKCPDYAAKVEEYMEFVDNEGQVTIRDNLVRGNTGVTLLCGAYAVHDCLTDAGVTNVQLSSIIERLRQFSGFESNFPSWALAACAAEYGFSLILCIGTKASGAPDLQNSVSSSCIYPGAKTLCILYTANHYRAVLKNLCVLSETTIHDFFTQDEIKGGDKGIKHDCFISWSEDEVRKLKQHLTVQPAEDHRRIVEIKSCCRIGYQSRYNQLYSFLKTIGALYDSSVPALKSAIDDLLFPHCFDGEIFLEEVSMDEVECAAKFSFTGTPWKDSMILHTHREDMAVVDLTKVSSLAFYMRGICLDNVTALFFKRGSRWFKLGEPGRSTTVIRLFSTLSAVDVRDNVSLEKSAAESLKTWEFDTTEFQKKTWVDILEEPDFQSQEESSMKLSAEFEASCMNRMYKSGAGDIVTEFLKCLLRLLRNLTSPVWKESTCTDWYRTHIDLYFKYRHDISFYMVNRVWQSTFGFSPKTDTDARLAGTNLTPDLALKTTNGIAYIEYTTSRSKDIKRNKQIKYSSHIKDPDRYYLLVNNGHNQFIRDCIEVSKSLNCMVDLPAFESSRRYVSLCNSILYKSPIKKEIYEAMNRGDKGPKIAEDRPMKTVPVKRFPMTKAALNAQVTVTSPITIPYNTTVRYAPAMSSVGFSCCSMENLIEQAETSLSLTHEVQYMLDQFTFDVRESDFSCLMHMFSEVAKVLSSMSNDLSMKSGESDARLEFFTLLDQFYKVRHNLFSGICMRRVLHCSFEDYNRPYPIDTDISFKEVFGIESDKTPDYILHVTGKSYVIMEFQVANDISRIEEQKGMSKDRSKYNREIVELEGKGYSIHWAVVYYGVKDRQSNWKDVAQDLNMQHGMVIDMEFFNTHFAKYKSILEDCKGLSRFAGILFGEGHKISSEHYERARKLLREVSSRNKIVKSCRETRVHTARVCPQFWNRLNQDMAQLRDKLAKEESQYCIIEYSRNKGISVVESKTGVHPTKMIRWLDLNMYSTLFKYCMTTKGRDHAQADVSSVPNTILVESASPKTRPSEEVKIKAHSSHCQEPVAIPIVVNSSLGNESSDEFCLAFADGWGISDFCDAVEKIGKGMTKEGAYLGTNRMTPEHVDFAFTQYTLKLKEEMSAVKIHKAKRPFMYPVADPANLNKGSREEWIKEFLVAASACSNEGCKMIIDRVAGNNFRPYNDVNPSHEEELSMSRLNIQIAERFEILRSTNRLLTKIEAQQQDEQLGRLVAEQQVVLHRVRRRRRALGEETIRLNTVRLSKDENHIVKSQFDFKAKDGFDEDWTGYKNWDNNLVENILEDTADWLMRENMEQSYISHEEYLEVSNDTEGPMNLKRLYMEGYRGSMEAAARTNAAGVARFITSLCHALLHFSNTNLRGTDYHVSNLGCKNVLLVAKGGKKIHKTGNTRPFFVIFPMSAEMVKYHRPTTSRVVQHDRIFKYEGQYYYYSGWSILNEKTAVAGLSLLTQFICQNVTYTQRRINSGYSASKRQTVYSFMLALHNRRSLEKKLHDMKYLLANATGCYTGFSTIMPSMAFIPMDVFQAAFVKRFSDTYASYCHAMLKCTESGYKDPFAVMEIPHPFYKNEFLRGREDFVNVVYGTFMMTKAPYYQALEQCHNLASILEIHREFVNTVGGIDYCSVAEKTDKPSDIFGSKFNYSSKACELAGRLLADQLKDCGELPSLAREWNRLMAKNHEDYATSSGLRGPDVETFRGRKGHEIAAIEYVKHASRVEAETGMKVLDIVKSIEESGSHDMVKVKDIRVFDRPTCDIVNILANKPLIFSVADKEQRGGARELYVMDLYTKLQQKRLEEFMAYLSTKIPNEFIHVPSDQRAGVIHSTFFESYDDSGFESFYNSFDCAKWAPMSNLNKFVDFTIGLSPALPPTFTVMLLSFFDRMYWKRAYMSTQAVELLQGNKRYDHLTGYLEYDSEKCMHYLTMPYSFLMGIFNYFSSIIHAVNQQMASVVFSRCSQSSKPAYLYMKAHSDDSAGYMKLPRGSDVSYYLKLYEASLKLMNHILSVKKCLVSKIYFELISILYLGEEFIPVTNKFINQTVLNLTGLGFTYDMNNVNNKVIELVKNGATQQEAYFCTRAMAKNVCTFYGIPYDNSIPIQSMGAADSLPIQVLMGRSWADTVRLFRTNPEKTFKYLDMARALGANIDLDMGTGCFNPRLRRFATSVSLRMERDLNEMFGPTLEYLDVVTDGLAGTINYPHSLLQGVSLLAKTRQEGFSQAIAGITPTRIVTRTMQLARSRVVETNMGEMSYLDISKLMKRAYACMEMSLSPNEAIKEASGFELDPVLYKKNSDHMRLIYHHCMYESGTLYNALDYSFTERMEAIDNILSCKPLKLETYVSDVVSQVRNSPESVVLYIKTGNKWLTDKIGLEKDALTMHSTLRQYGLDSASLSAEFLMMFARKLGNKGVIKSFLYGYVRGDSRHIASLTDLISFIKNSSIYKKRIVKTKNYGHVVANRLNGPGPFSPDDIYSLEALSVACYLKCIIQGFGITYHGIEYRYNDLVEKISKDGPLMPREVARNHIMMNAASLAVEGRAQHYGPGSSTPQWGMSGEEILDSFSAMHSIFSWVESGQRSGQTWLGSSRLYVRLPSAEFELTFKEGEISEVSFKYDTEVTKLDSISNMYLCHLFGNLGQAFTMTPGNPGNELSFGKSRTDGSYTIDLVSNLSVYVPKVNLVDRLSFHKKLDGLTYHSNRPGEIHLSRPRSRRVDLTIQDLVAATSTAALPFADYVNMASSMNSWAHDEKAKISVRARERLESIFGRPEKTYKEAVKNIRSSIFYKRIIKPFVDEGKSPYELAKQCPEYNKEGFATIIRSKFEDKSVGVTEEEIRGLLSTVKADEVRAAISKKALQHKEGLIPAQDIAGCITAACKILKEVAAPKTPGAKPQVEYYQAASKELTKENNEIILIDPLCNSREIKDASESCVSIVNRINKAMISTQYSAVAKIHCYKHSDEDGWNPDFRKVMVRAMAYISFSHNGNYTYNSCFNCYIQVLKDLCRPPTGEQFYKSVTKGTHLEHITGDWTSKFNSLKGAIWSCTLRQHFARLPMGECVRPTTVVVDESMFMAEVNNRNRLADPCGHTLYSQLISGIRIDGAYSVGCMEMFMKSTFRVLQNNNVFLYQFDKGGTPVEQKPAFPHELVRYKMKDSSDLNYWSVIVRNALNVYDQDETAEMSAAIRDLSLETELEDLACDEEVDVKTVSAHDLKICGGNHSKYNFVKMNFKVYSFIGVYDFQNYCKAISESDNCVLLMDAIPPTLMNSRRHTSWFRVKQKYTGLPNKLLYVVFISIGPLHPVKIASSLDLVRVKREELEMTILNPDAQENVKIEYDGEVVNCSHEVAKLCCDRYSADDDDTVKMVEETAEPSPSDLTEKELEEFDAAPWAHVDPWYFLNDYKKDEDAVEFIRSQYEVLKGKDFADSLAAILQATDRQGWDTIAKKVKVGEALKLQEMTEEEDNRFMMEMMSAFSGCEDQLMKIARKDPMQDIDLAMLFSEYRGAELTLREAYDMLVDRHPGVPIFKPKSTIAKEAFELLGEGWSDIIQGTARLAPEDRDKIAGCASRHIRALTRDRDEKMQLGQYCILRFLEVASEQAEEINSHKSYEVASWSRAISMYRTLPEPKNIKRISYGESRMLLPDPVEDKSGYFSFMVGDVEFEESDEDSTIVETEADTQSDNDSL